MPAAMPATRMPATTRVSATRMSTAETLRAGHLRSLAATKTAKAPAAAKAVRCRHLRLLIPSAEKMEPARLLLLPERLVPARTRRPERTAPVRFTPAEVPAREPLRRCATRVRLLPAAHAAFPAVVVNLRPVRQPALRTAIALRPADRRRRAVVSLRRSLPVSRIHRGIAAAVLVPIPAIPWPRNSVSCALTEPAAGTDIPVPEAAATRPSTRERPHSAAPETPIRNRSAMRSVVSMVEKDALRQPAQAPTQPAERRVIERPHRNSPVPTAAATNPAPTRRTNPPRSAD